MSGARLERIDRYTLPLADGDVLRHFLERHRVAHSLEERLRGAVARWSVDLGIDGLARALVRRDRTADPGPRADGVEERVERLFRAAGVTHDGRWIQLHDYGAAPGMGGLLFGFSHPSLQPVIVLKTRAMDSGRPSLERERRVLRRLRSHLPAGLRNTVPAPRRYADTDGMEILAMSFLPGRPVYLEVHDRLRPAPRAGRHLRAAVSWLTAFRRATVDPTGRREDGSGLPGTEVLREALGSEPERGSPRSDELEWLYDLRQAFDREGQLLSAAHGDFWARNVLVEGAEVRGVVDWEHYRPRSLPGTDLFHFLLTYGLTFPWRRRRTTAPLEAVRRTFVEENEVSRAVRDSVLAYSSALSLPPECLRGLFLLFLLTRGGPITADHVQPRNVLGDRRTWTAAYRVLRTAERSVFSP